MKYLISIPVIGLFALMIYAIYDFNFSADRPAVPAAEAPVAVDLPANKLLERRETITERVWRRRPDMAQMDEDDLLQLIDTTISEIRDDYGRNSDEHIQAVTESMLVLNDLRRNGLAVRYGERAVEMQRKTYGDKHRATALAINDLANLKIEASETRFSEEAIPLLEEATQIREAVLSPDHLETAGGQATLGEQLFAAWQVAEPETREDALLARAEAALSDATRAYENSGATALLDYHLAKVMIGQIAYAREDYERAASLLEASLPPVAPDSDLQLLFMFERPYTAYVNALLKLERTEEAETFQARVAERLRAAAEAQQAEASADDAVND